MRSVTIDINGELHNIGIIQQVQLNKFVGWRHPNDYQIGLQPAVIGETYAVVAARLYVLYRQTHDVPYLVDLPFRAYQPDFERNT